MSDEMVTALNNLAVTTGEMKGEFKGLKKYIESKTDNCQVNYESLSGKMVKLTSKINGVVIENEVEGRFKKILYNRVTLLCTIIGLAIAFAGLQNMNTKKADKKLVKISKELRQIKTSNAMLVKETHGR
jgi:hypothetical protein